MCGGYDSILRGGAISGISPVGSTISVKDLEFFHSVLENGFLNIISRITSGKMSWSNLAKRIATMMSTTDYGFFDMVPEVEAITTDAQEGMDMIVDAFLDGSRYYNEFADDAHKVIEILMQRGAKFPIERMFEFNDWSIENQIANFNVRAHLLKITGCADLNEIDAVYWEDVMDEKPTKEILLCCLKWYIDKL